MRVNLLGVIKARGVIGRYPSTDNPHPSTRKLSADGCDVYVKHENHNPTGSLRSAARSSSSSTMSG
jgi:threonine synthase